MIGAREFLERRVGELARFFAGYYGRSWANIVGTKEGMKRRHHLRVGRRQFGPTFLLEMDRLEQHALPLGFKEFLVREERERKLGERRARALLVPELSDDPGSRQLLPSSVNPAPSDPGVS